MAEKRDIKYINREFSDFKENLTEYAKAYFPDTYNDFSPTSPGTMFMEMAAYVGDVLSFYQDTQLQETFIQYAKDPSNLYDMAYMLGYKPKQTAPSQVKVTISQIVDATGTSLQPNWAQAVTIEENAQLQSSTNPPIEFIIPSKVDFTFSSSYEKTDVVVNQYDATGPVSYRLSKTVDAMAANLVTTTQTFGSATAYETITIEDDNIIGILDIVDSDGNVWYEVPYLGQETIIVDQANTESDNDKVKSSLNLQQAPRRFVTRFTSKGILQIQFGAGVSTQDDTEFIPNPAKVLDRTIDPALHQFDKGYDPSNFLFTSTYGLAPSNTTLTITYMTGGGVESNVGAGKITTLLSSNITADDSTKVDTVSVTNTEAASGGKDGDTIYEIRLNAQKAFNEQKRAVTAQDYAFRALALPERFGTIAKSYVANDTIVYNDEKDMHQHGANFNPFSIGLYILTYNNNKNLSNSTPTLRSNLKKYLSQYMMMTDAVDIRDAYIINIGVNFEVILRPSASPRVTLKKCTEKVQEYFAIDRWNINQPINLAQIYPLLDRVEGVQTVENVEIINKVGGEYSNLAYDIIGATRRNIVYPSVDPMCFEVKFPNIDIKGKINTL